MGFRPDTRALDRSGIFRVHHARMFAQERAVAKILNASGIEGHHRANDDEVVAFMFAIL